MRYPVYGDYGYVNETVLFESDSRDDSVRWAKNYCRRDMGGYNIIEVAYFAANDEYVPVWRTEADTDELVYDEF